MFQNNGNLPTSCNLMPAKLIKMIYYTNQNIWISNGCWLHASLSLFVFFIVDIALTVLSIYKTQQTNSLPIF